MLPKILEHDLENSWKFPRVFSHTFQPPSADCSLVLFLVTTEETVLYIFFLSNGVSKVSNEAKNSSTANDVGQMWMIYNASSGSPYLLSYPTIKFESSAALFTTQKALTSLYLH